MHVWLCCSGDHQSHKQQTLADLRKGNLDVVVTTFETCRDNIVSASLNADYELQSTTDIMRLITSIFYSHIAIANDIHCQMSSQQAPHVLP